MEIRTIALLVIVTIFIIATFTIFIKAVNEHAKLKEQEKLIKDADNMCTPGKHYVFYGNGNGNPFTETKHECIILETIDDYVKYKEIDTAPNGKQAYSGTNSCLKVTLYRTLTSKNAKNTIYYDAI